MGTSVGNRVGVYYNSSLGVFSRIASDGISYDTPTIPFVDRSAKVALSFKEGGEAILAYNGVTARSANIQLPVVNNLNIGGSFSGLRINAAVGGIRYYPRALAESELQELTS